MSVVNCDVKKVVNVLPHLSFNLLLCCLRDSVEAQLRLEAHLSELTIGYFTILGRIGATDTVVMILEMPKAVLEQRRAYGQVGE